MKSNAAAPPPPPSPRQGAGTGLNGFALYALAMGNCCEPLLRMMTDQPDPAASSASDGVGRRRGN